MCTTTAAALYSMPASGWCSLTSVSMSVRSSASVTSSSGVTAARLHRRSRTARLEDSAPWLPMRTIGSSSAMPVSARSVPRSRPETTATCDAGQARERAERVDRARLGRWRCMGSACEAGEHPVEVGGDEQDRRRLPPPRGPRGSARWRSCDRRPVRDAARLVARLAARPAAATRWARPERGSLRERGRPRARLGARQLGRRGERGEVARGPALRRRGRRRGGAAPA